MIPSIRSFLLTGSLPSRMTPEQNAVLAVADLMALAARTSPKGKGTDTLEIRVLAKNGCKKLSKHLEAMGNERGIGFFIRDARNIADAEACVLIGSRAGMIAGINCGACGYPTCADFEKAVRRKKSATPYSGPNCVIRVTDLGIAVGSAVKTAQIHNADNRIMYSGGVAALDMGLLPGECTVAYAIPLAGTGKNIFFDRPSSR